MRYIKKTGIKFFFIISFFVVMLCSLFGCQAEYTFVKSNSDIKIFDVFSSVGGVLKEIFVTTDGYVELEYQFDRIVQSQDMVDDLNKKSLENLKFLNGFRVVELKESKDVENKTSLTIYTTNIEHLSSSQIKMGEKTLFEEQSRENLFVDVEKNAVEYSSVASNQKVVFFSGIFEDVKVIVNGKIVAVSQNGLVEVGKEIAVFSSQNAFVVFEDSYSSLIWIVTISIAVIFGIVFFILVKCRVFTSMAVKKIYEDEK